MLAIRTLKYIEQVTFYLFLIKKISIIETQFLHFLIADKKIIIFFLNIKKKRVYFDIYIDFHTFSEFFSLN